MASNNSGFQDCVQIHQGHAGDSTSNGGHKIPTVNDNIISSSPSLLHSNFCVKASPVFMPSWLHVSGFTGFNSSCSLRSSLQVDEQAFAAVQRRFLIFDQSGGCTRLMFSSLQPQFRSSKLLSQQGKLTWHTIRHHLNTDCQPCNATFRSEETDVSDGSAIPEDSSEIDALLYSDSELNSEEELSNGCFPSKTAFSNEEVASSDIPSKRRRLNEDENMYFVHKAPSTSYSQASKESSCVKGSRRDTTGETIFWSPSNCKNHRKRNCRRDHILETVGVLRRIIPGGNGKDATMVLDKAIQYLRSLKLKSKFPETAHG